MLSKRLITVLWIIERIFVILLISAVLGTVWHFRGQVIPSNWLYGGTVIAGGLLLIIFLIQSRINAWYSTLQTQKDFAETEEFDSLYERSPVAYLVVDVAGSVKTFNPAAVNLLHATKDAMNKVNFFRLILPDTEVDVAVLQQKIQAGMTVNDKEVALQTASGEKVWVIMSIYNHRNKGLRLISLVDVTEQKNVDTAKSEFVALATHQLRTPIAAIRWNVELLHKNMGETVTEKQLRYLTKIERNVLRMISLINDFLSVSKLEMGTFAASIETMNLSEFFDSVLDEYQEKITEKNLQLIRNDEPPQAYVKTDSRLFHIIVSNLLSNAVKYIVPDGKLTLTYELSGESLRIVAADTGIGIPEGELDKMFTKFYRASNAQAHQTEGTGLGLYVVKQSVDILNGTITVESQENVGTKFVVTVPVAVVSTGEVG